MAGQLKFPKPRAYKLQSGYAQARDAFFAWVREQPSIVSGRTPCTVAHVKTRGSGGDDFFNVVPLTAAEHRIQEDLPQREFEERYGVDLQEVAFQVTRKYLKKNKVVLPEELWTT
jgi:hypothetical protein